MVIRNWLDRVTQLALLLLLFMLPFSKASIEVLFCVLFLVWIVRFLVIRDTPSVWTMPQTRLLLGAIIGFLFFNALSIAISTNIKLSINGFFSKWCEYILFFIITADFIYEKPVLAKRSLYVICLSSALVVFEALSQEITGKGFFRGYPLMMYERMTGPYENPIDLAIYIMGVIPILLALSVHVNRMQRWLTLTILLLVAGCLARTESQGVWLASAVSVAAFIMLGKGLRRVPLIFSGFVMTVGFIILALTHGLGRIFVISVGLQDRWAMWQAALGMIQARPWFGHGVNTFMDNYLTYWVAGERMPRYAHNCYLQIWAEIGLFGLLCMLWLGWQQWRLYKRALDQTPEPINRSLLLGLTAALLGFWIHAFIDTDWYSLRHAALFWILSGVATGWALSLKPSNAT